jgi:lysophospholipase L1-like esterase
MGIRKSLNACLLPIPTCTCFVDDGMNVRVLIFGVLLAGVTSIATCSNRNMASTFPIPGSEARLHYLALGDSYTIGESVAASERFPHLTAERLRAQNIPMTEPEYIATTGWTTQNLLTAINEANGLKTYDVVTLLIGVNDQYQGLDTAGYRERFSQLLEKAVKLAGNRPGRVFVLSIPDYSATPFVAEKDKSRVQAEIDAFNAINKEITLARNIAYVDITPVTRQAVSEASLLAGDGLHYSAKAHQQWAALLAPLIQQALKS